MMPTNGSNVERAFTVLLSEKDNAFTAAPFLVDGSCHIVATKLVGLSQSANGLHVVLLSCSLRCAGIA